MVQPVVSLLHAEHAAVRVPSIIKPSPLIHPNRVHDKRVIVRPFPDRVSIPLRVGVLRKPSPVFPDDPPNPLVLIQHQHLVGSLNDLKWAQFKQQVARKTRRVAAVQWIIHQPNRDSSWSVSGLVEIVGYAFSPGGERSMRLHTRWGDALHPVCNIPNSRQVTARGRGRLLTLRHGRLLGGSGLSARAERKSQYRDDSNDRVHVPL